LRRLIVILLLTVFLFSTSGIFISEHYCCNHLKSISFFKIADKCCKDDCPYCKNISGGFKVKIRYLQPNDDALNFSVNNINLFFNQFSDLIISEIHYQETINLIEDPPGNLNINIITHNFRL